MNVWEEVQTKSVLASDGFLTDYTWYTNGELHIFVFGDKDIYEPDLGNADWTCESREEAEAWFENYVGFVHDSRTWVAEMDEIDIDCIQQYEAFLGRKLRDREEYIDIDQQVDEMILEYASADEFFTDYPGLKIYCAEAACKPSLADQIQSASTIVKSSQPYGKATVIQPNSER